MNEELDYAEMLEIPVSTVNVVKKKSIFKRREKAQAKAEAEEAGENLKDQVVESVNGRMGAYVFAEDLSDPVKPEKQKAEKAVKTAGKDKAKIILLTETLAVGLIALAIFVTNVFMPHSAINNFITSFSKTASVEPAYTELKLAPVTNSQDANLTLSESGVLSFTATGSVYPICKGTVSKVYESEGIYTLEIEHTSTFTSVVTGLSNVFSAEGTDVVTNIPVGYSDGSRAVQVSMYDNGTLLNCYTLSGEVPVWIS